MKTVNINKISAIFLGAVLLTSVLSSVAYAGGVPINPIVNKTSTQTVALPGGEWDFTLGVLNDGTETLDFAVLGDPLDSSLEFVSVVNDSDCFYDDIEHEVVCFIIALATGEEFTTDVTVRVLPSTPSGTEIPNTAHVFVDEDDIPEDSSDPIFLFVGTEDACKCEELSIKPRLLNGRSFGVFVNRVKVEKDGAALEVSVMVPWTATTLCSGSPGECKGTFVLSGSDENWMVNVNTGNQRTAESTIFGEEFGHKEVDKRQTLKPGPDKQPNSIQCEGACPATTKKPVERTVYTQYKTTLFVPGADISFDVTGKITLEIKATEDFTCVKKKGWKMILAIDSRGQNTIRGDTKLLSIDIPDSDFDGDGRTNRQEAGKDGMINTKDDPKNAKGVPDWLNPAVKT